MKRLAVVVRRERIEVADLDEAIRNSADSRSGVGRTRSLADAVAELDRDLIVATLEKCHSNQQHAARALGLSRQGLLNKIKRYEILLRKS